MFSFKLPLHYKIIIGMLIGSISGLLLQFFGVSQSTISTILLWVKPVGDIFLRFIFMMVIPLLLGALINGISEIDDLKKLGSIGLKTLYYTIVVSMISVFIGITMVIIFKPGADLSATDRSMLIEKFQDKVSTVTSNMELVKNKNIGDIISQIVPKNPLEDMVRAFDSSYSGGGILAVMFFGLMLGIALNGLDPIKAKPVKDFFESLFEVSMRLINMAMQLAPYGVAALLFSLTSSMGFSIIFLLLKYFSVCFTALCIHQFGTFSLILKYIAKVSPRLFFKNIQEVMLTAFSTSSSNATLPTALRVVNEKLSIPKPIANFVLTIGSTANQNGTALYEGVTVLFLAQCFGVDLSIGQQFYVMIICILAGIGTAGVPGGSLPVIAIILTTIGVPAAAIGIIIGVDRLLDMCRTVLNVTGDIVAAQVVARWESASVLGKNSVL